MKNIQRAGIVLILLIGLSVGIFCTATAEEKTDISSLNLYNRWVWIGDSRIADMQKVMPEMEIIAKTGAGLKFIEEHFDEINELRNCNIIFNMGINDFMHEQGIGEKWAFRYIEMFEKFSEKFFSENKVCFMAINPTDHQRRTLNSNIEDFNMTIWKNLPKTWIYLDTYSWLVTRGFETTDGLRYTEDTYRRIYQIVTTPRGFWSIVKPLPPHTAAIEKWENRIVDRLEFLNDSTANCFLSDDVVVFVEEFGKEGSPFGSSYVFADIYLKDVHDLKAYYQTDETWGLGDVDTIERMSNRVGALISCNGDFYVLENTDKEILRNGERILTLDESGQRDWCVLYHDGTMETVPHQLLQAEPELMEQIRNDAWQIWSFGPRLLDDHGMAIEDFSDCNNPNIIGPNPRTALGSFGKNHFCILFISGRVNGNRGATFQEMSKFFESIGCEKAYNLDGGGTSHIWYDGEMLGEPCEPRKFSDILYIEYPSDDMSIDVLNDFSDMLWYVDAYMKHEQINF